MKPFSLQTVLSYRQRLEDIAVNTLAEAKQAEQQTKVRLAEQQKVYDSLVALIDRIQNEGVSINDLIHQEDHLTFVKVKIKELETELTERQNTVAKRQEELLQKSRDRQVMDKLKERQNSAYRQYLNKKEAAILDEIAIIYHNK